jgi:tRNA modification GTPase
MLLHELLKLGARPAEPGEFTARAYFNGKFDLTGAEGVAATIAAGNAQELSAARRLMSGELARRIAPILDLVADSLALVEAGIDFSEEGISFLSAAELRERAGRADAALQTLLAESARFERLAHEPRVALVGRPNAGKSTLLNALAGRERAVVSSTAGTTRDALSAEVSLRRGAIQVIDVAGIDEPCEQQASHSEIDAKMQRTAARAVEEADLLILVHSLTDARAALARVMTNPEAFEVELLALEFREALEALGAILGRVTPDDLLGRIFSGFCIGK